MGKRRAPRGDVEREVGAPFARRTGHETLAVEREVGLPGLQLEIAVEVLERAHAIGARACAKLPLAGALEHEVVGQLPRIAGRARQHHDDRCRLAAPDIHKTADPAEGVELLLLFLDREHPAAAERSRE
jgi:hypothetical protein